MSRVVSLRVLFVCIAVCLLGGALYAASPVTVFTAPGSVVIFRVQEEADSNGGGGEKSN